MPMSSLPPGQHALNHFPRFGLSEYADRIPDVPDPWTFEIAGDAPRATIDAASLATVPRTEQTSDFHCVTTWSRLGLRWRGWRFRDVCHALLGGEVYQLVMLRGRDRYVTALRYDDACADDVLLADTLDGAPLPLEHGAPLRFLAPAHYGYKNVKYVERIDFLKDPSRFRYRGLRRIIDHPRARVAHEERGNFLPGVVYRVMYRPFVKPTIRQFERAWEQRK